MDEKQPSRFVIFHLEVFVTSLHQVFPFPHPIMTIDILTTAVYQTKKTRKIPFLQTIRLQTTKQSPVRNDGHNSIVETSENTDPTTMGVGRIFSVGGQ